MEQKNSINNNLGLVDAVLKGLGQVTISTKKSIDWIIAILIAYGQNNKEALQNYFGRHLNRAKDCIDRFLDSLVRVIDSKLRQKRRSVPLYYDQQFAYPRDSMEEEEERQAFSRSVKTSMSQSNLQNVAFENEGLSDEEKISMASTAESARIHKLEMELALLRQQMSMLIANQTITKVVAEPSLMNGVDSKTTLAPGIGGRPPPPPPPSPSLLRSQPRFPAIKAQDLQQVRLNHVGAGDQKSSSTVKDSAIKKPSMDDVFNEMKTFQLRKTNNPPGPKEGTHGNDRRPNAASCDQASFLAGALFDKFKNVKQSESVNEDTDSSHATDEEDLWEV